MKLKATACTLLFLSAFAAAPVIAQGDDVHFYHNTGPDASLQPAVELFRPLEGRYGDPTYDGVSRLPRQLYSEQVFLSYIALGVSAPPSPSREEAQKRSGLSDFDKQTLLLTEIRDLEPNIYGYRKGSMRLLRDILASAQPRDEKPIDTLSFLRSAYERFRPPDGPKGIYEDYGRSVMAKMQDLPYMYQLLIRLHWLRQNDAHKSADFWDPLIERTNKLIRQELVYLDQEIKRATSLNQDEGEFLASAVMLILTATDSPARNKMLDDILTNLEPKFTLNVLAMQHLTRAFERFHSRVIVPNTGRLTMVTAATAGAWLLSYVSGYEPGLVYSSFANGWTVPAFLAVIAERFIGGHWLISRATNRLDRLIARLGSLMLRERGGELSTLITLSRNDLMAHCEAFLAQHHTSDAPMAE